MKRTALKVEVAWGGDAREVFLDCGHVVGCHPDVAPPVGGRMTCPFCSQRGHVFCPPRQTWDPVTGERG